MSNSVIVGQVCMYNEVITGNLDRCLDNLRHYCDHIVIYDDASTDNSVEIARKYTEHIICGATNNQMEELLHKQMILEKSLELGATYLFWLDCDEVLDRNGTMGGLRELCDNWPEGLDAYSFRETNLWRSESYVRIDSLFDKGRFVRLWKVVPDIKIKVTNGVHLKLYPETINTVREAPLSVIHYGFSDYKKMMVKIGVHSYDAATLQTVARDNWILNETNCSCYKLADEVFPPGCLPPDNWPQPYPRMIDELIPYQDVAATETGFVDMRSIKEWSILHSHDYHGGYKAIHKRNSGVWRTAQVPIEQRIALFKFDATDKIVYDLGCGGGQNILESIVNGAKQVIGFEINSKIIAETQKSFKALKVPKNQYQLINMLELMQKMDIPPADIIYSIAVFMHIPWWQGKKYLEWFYNSANVNCEVYIQYYQYNDETMFWNGLDSISVIRLENFIERLGFSIESREWFQGNTDVPLWRLYKLIKT